MAFADKLRANFAVFDYKIVNNSVIPKFAKICRTFDVDEDGIVEKWIEFVDQKETSSTDITAENVKGFKKWCTANIELRSDSDQEKPSTSDDDFLDEEEELLENKKKKEASEILERTQMALDASRSTTEDDDDILKMYGLKKDSTKKNIQHESSSADPEIHEDKENDNEDLNASTMQSKGGEIVLKFGFAVSDWNNELPRKSQVERKGFPHVASLERFLYNRMTDFVILNDLCCMMSRVFCKIWQKDKEQLVVTSNVREKTFNRFRTWGRIVSDNNGKLTTASILLMGDPKHWYHSLGEYEPEEDLPDDIGPDYIEELEEEEDETDVTLGDSLAIEIRKQKNCVPLDVSRLKCYSFFPGQVISVEGKNPTKESFCAYKVIPGISFGPEPPELNEPLQIVVAAGPFTTKPGDYKQLYDLMAHVAQTKPNVCILIGPFITESDIKSSQKDMFEGLISKIMNYLNNTSTQVVLVSSYQDVLHDGFYPTPEYRLHGCSSLNPNLHSMPDPCTIEVDGLTIGITSVDIIRHLSSEEISFNMPQRERLGRIAEHLLLQSSYYPLYPPAQEVPLDVPLWAECSTMNLHPHILIVPSAMQYFYKYSNGTHIINPSKVSKGLYSQFNVRANDKWDENSIGGEILRI